MPADEHGLTDNAVMEAHDMIHHAEQEEHEYEAAMKRGITDEAAEAEYTFIHGAEQRAAREEVSPPPPPNIAQLSPYHWLKLFSKGDVTLLARSRRPWSGSFRGNIKQRCLASRKRKRLKHCCAGRWWRMMHCTIRCYGLQ